MMIFLLISIFLIILVFSLDQLIKRMYRYEKKKHGSTPEKYQIPFDEVRIPASGDTYRYGWWIPASPDAPTLILVHGWGRNLARMMRYIQELHPMGYNLLAFDARNHGSSSSVKHPTVGTFSEDTLAAVDFVAKNGLTSSHNIGVIGHSVGGGAAINAAGWDHRITSVITVGAISHPVEVMNSEFKKRRVPSFVAATLLAYMRFRFRLDFNKIAPVNNIPNAKADIFIIHGYDDETVPLEQGRALEAAGKKEKTHLWIVPGKGHSDCDTHPQFWEKVSAFLHRTLPISLNSFPLEKKMNKTYTRSDSKVEVTGFEARYYDLLMNTITGGTYPFFIRNAIREMQIQPGDNILVLGAGTGRNMDLMDKYLSGKGRITGLDVGPEMLEQAQRRFTDHPYITIEKQRIEEPLPYQSEFDKVFISFVLHGFIQKDRLKIIANGQRALRPGGEFIILDYNESDLKQSPWPVRFVFKMECPLATDFIGRDLQAILRGQGFDEFRVHPHYMGYVRLLAARKAG